MQYKDTMLNKYASNMKYDERSDEFVIRISRKDVVRANFSGQGESSISDLGVNTPLESITPDFLTSRGSGHTHAMCNDLKDTECWVLCSTMEAGRYIANKHGINMNRIVPLGDLNRLVGSNKAIVIDNSAMMDILGMAINEISREAF